MTEPKEDILIEVENLSKTFGKMQAVKDISLKVVKGTTVAFLGPNGAGKTTTLCMMTGILTPTSGDIRMFGMNMKQSRHDIAGRINYASPYIELPWNMRVGDVLDVYCRYYNVKDRRKRLAKLAKELKIGDFLTGRFGRLSAGQKTRVSLAKGLLNSPEILFLDEPTASLDPETSEFIRSYIERTQEETGMTVVMASHNMAEVERMAKTVVMMKDGNIVEQAAPSTLIRRHGRRNLEDVFLAVARGEEGAELT